MDNSTCQICNHLINKEQMPTWINVVPYDGIDCQRCGKYFITNDAQSFLPNFKDKYKLSAWIRDMNEKGAEPPKFNLENVKKFENSLPDYSPSQKQLKLMQNIERRTEFPGKSIHLIPQDDYPLSWASSEDEIMYYLDNLVDRKLLDLPSKDHQEINNLICIVRITAHGWDYLDEHSKKSAVSDQAFVAMSFSGNIDSAYEKGIKKAIEKAGYQSYKVGDKPHNERIDVKIMAEIKNSRFLVADVTEHKQGVYFEAGYALGLGIPVIWSCRKDDLKTVHFDTRQYNHIVWKDEDQLREELFNFICAIIGKNA